MANWTHISRTIDELKNLVRDAYDRKIFTSLQIDNKEITKLSMVFMPMLFIGSAPCPPNLDGDNQKNRRAKLQYIQDCIEYEEDTKKRETYLKHIGMVYEYYDKASPRGINGMPI